MVKYDLRTQTTDLSVVLCVCVYIVYTHTVHTPDTLHCMYSMNCTYIRTHHIFISCWFLVFTTYFTKCLQIDHFIVFLGTDVKPTGPSFSLFLIRKSVVTVLQPSGLLSILQDFSQVICKELTFPFLKLFWIYILVFKLSKWIFSLFYNIPNWFLLSFI